MNDSHKEAFFALVADVYAFYSKNTSRFALKVWWDALKPFDFDAVNQALGMHCMNPDNGQYLPKPSDVVKLLRGSSQDSALEAWTKVDTAVRTVGTYSSVSFDDPIILRVLQDMGGLDRLGHQKGGRVAIHRPGVRKPIPRVRHAPRAGVSALAAWHC